MNKKSVMLMSALAVLGAAGFAAIRIARSGSEAGSGSFSTSGSSGTREEHVASLEKKLARLERRLGGMAVGALGKASSESEAAPPRQRAVPPETQLRFLDNLVATEARDLNWAPNRIRVVQEPAGAVSQGRRQVAFVQDDAVSAGSGTCSHGRAGGVSPRLWSHAPSGHARSRGHQERSGRFVDHRDPHRLSRGLLRPTWPRVERFVAPERAQTSYFGGVPLRRSTIRLQAITETDVQGADLALTAIHGES